MGRATITTLKTPDLRTIPKLRYRLFSQSALINSQNDFPPPKNTGSAIKATGRRQKYHLSDSKFALETSVKQSEVNVHQSKNGNGCKSPGFSMLS